MMIKRVLTSLLIALCVSPALSQDLEQPLKASDREAVPERKFRVSTPWLSFVNFGEERTNTYHYELHVKYSLDSKNILGLKFATWRLFQPMGILWWDGLLDKINTQSEFYPGYLRETGLGVSYQRMLWKGLFATVEVLPQFKTNLDINHNKIGNGFKLYTSYHVGYHFNLLKGRMFLEPQIHCQYWPIDTNTPQAFKELDNKWKNYFLLEPNLYIGVKF